jgi:hypothetical protein
MPGGLGGEDAVGPLREAKAFLSLVTRLRAAFWVFAVIATFMTLVAMAAWPVGLVAKLILLTLAVAPTAFAVRARSRASKFTASANEALGRAWLAAAEDAATHAKNGITVAELASRLKIAPVKAEKLLSELAVHDRTRIDVDDDAEIRYSIAPEVKTKVRVDSDPTEDQFRALEEAEAHSKRAGAIGVIGEDASPKPRQMTVEEEANDPTRVPFPRPGR